MKLKYGPYSPSRLDTAACPYNFFNTYVEPKAIARAEGLAQARGSAVHEVNEQITARLKEGLTVTDEMLREWTTKAVHAHPLAYQELQEIMEMARLYVRRPPATLTPNSEIELKLAVKITLDENGNPVTYQDIIDEREVTRYTFEACDYNDPDALARGRADILTISDDTTKAYIIDHKTQPNFEDAETFQMGFYAWVILQTYPFLDEVHTTLNFSRYGAYSQPFVWTKEDLYRIEDQLLTRIMIADTRTDWSISTPNKNCMYCPFIGECPTLKECIDFDEESGSYRVNMRTFDILADTQKAVKMAGLMNVVGEVYDKLQKNVKKFVQDNGPIAISGKVFEFKGTEKIHWLSVNKRREAVYEVFAKHNVDPRFFMGFSETFSKSIWLTENPALIKELSELFPRTVETRFSGSKV